MLFSTVIDYICGLVMTKDARDPDGTIQRLTPGGSRTGQQKAALIISICTNLAVLGFFKYFNFGMDSWNAVMMAVGADSATYENFLRITLPRYQFLYLPIDELFDRYFPR